jgi:hypothetical protein
MDTSAPGLAALGRPDRAHSESWVRGRTREDAVVLPVYWGVLPVSWAPPPSLLVPDPDPAVQDASDATLHGGIGAGAGDLGASPVASGLVSRVLRRTCPRSAC